MKITIVVAMTKNRVIGYQGGMPWHLPADLKHFKAVTMGKPIVMGRKTFESIGKPLPGRENVVITRQAGISYAGCSMHSSLEVALDTLGAHEEIMVIGGGEIFSQVLPKAESVHLTVIDTELEGDVYFPELDDASWETVSTETVLADEKNAHACTFLEMRRIKN